MERVESSQLMRAVIQNLHKRKMLGELLTIAHSVILGELYKIKLKYSKFMRTV